MALTQTLHSSKITNSPSLAPVTFKGETFDVYKCTVENLEEILLPQPSLSSTLYQSGAIVHDMVNNTFGYFILITGNPASTSEQDPLGNVLAAREVWLGKPDTGFLDVEFQREDVANKFTLTVPAVDHRIIFVPIRGANPGSAADSITPFGASNPVVSPSQIDTETLWGKTILELMKEIDDTNQALSDAGIDTFLQKEYTVEAGGILSVISGTTVQNDPTEYLFRGGRYSTLTNIQKAMVTKGLFRMELTPLGVLEATNALSSGTQDSYVQPGEDPITVGAPWVQIGTASGFDASGFHDFNVTTGTEGWSRSGTVSTVSNNSFTVDVKEHISGAEFSVLIDGGVGYYQEELRIAGDRITLASNGDYYEVSPDITRLRLDLDNVAQTSKVYLNDGENPVLESSSLIAGATNQFKIGFLTSTTGQTIIAEWRTVINAAPPSFALALGTVIGSVLRLKGTADFAGLVGREVDIKVGHRREGRPTYISDLDKAIEPYFIYFPSGGSPKFRNQGQIYSTGLSQALTVEPFSCLDITGTQILAKVTNTTINVAATVNGTTSGLAIGEALTTDTFYYLYAIGNGVTTLLMVSSVNASTGGSLAGKMPSGFNYYRQLANYFKTITSGGVKIIGFHQVGMKVAFRDFSFPSVVIASNQYTVNTWETVPNVNGLALASLAPQYDMLVYRDDRLDVIAYPDHGVNGYFWLMRDSATDIAFYDSRNDPTSGDNTFISFPNLPYPGLEFYTNSYHFPTDLWRRTLLNFYVSGYTLDEAKFL